MREEGTIGVKSFSLNHSCIKGAFSQNPTLCSRKLISGFLLFLFSACLFSGLGYETTGWGLGAFKVGKLCKEVDLKVEGGEKQA
jgi:hypothetical protein